MLGSVQDLITPRHLFSTEEMPLKQLEAENAVCISSAPPARVRP